jgi:hypothetical protein
LFFCNSTNNVLLSYYYPNTRTELWHNRPEILPSLTVKYQSYLPKETAIFKYPWVLERTRCPVTAETTDDWTEKQRKLASEAPFVESLSILGDYVCLEIHIFCTYK